MTLIDQRWREQLMIQDNEEDRNNNSESCSSFLRNLNRTVFTVVIIISIGKHFRTEYESSALAITQSH